MSEKTNYKVYVHIAPNGKRYYGITKQKVEARWKNGKGYGTNEYFYRAINKYGWDNFEHIVIARGLSEEEAKWLEVELIREHDTSNREYGYNISLGGEAHKGHKHTEETRKKLSERLKGHKHTEESRKKMSESSKGHKHTEETRKKMSEAHKGKTFTEESRKKMSESSKGKNNPNYGKTFSEEHRRKLSEAMTGKNNPNYGKTFTEETRKKMSEAHKGKKHPRATKVYCVELDMYFETIIEASEYISRDKSNISSVLRGKQKTAGGYHWIYAEDRDKVNKRLNN